MDAFALFLEDVHLVKMIIKSWKVKVQWLRNRQWIKYCCKKGKGVHKRFFEENIAERQSNMVLLSRTNRISRNSMLWLFFWTFALLHIFILIFSILYIDVVLPLNRLNPPNVSCIPRLHSAHLPRKSQIPAFPTSRLALPCYSQQHWIRSLARVRRKSVLKQILNGQDATILILAS